jgi:hypothetical protein
MHKLTYPLLLAFVLLLSSVSCTVTTGAVEGTSDSFAHTTGASTDLVKASTEVSSSTSASGDSDDEDSEKDDPEAKKKEEARLFAERNFAKLRYDIAVGNGEYLAAVAEIFDVSEGKLNSFYKMAKTSYSEISDDDATPDSMVEMLYHISKSLRS